MGVGAHETPVVLLLFFILEFNSLTIKESIPVSPIDCLSGFGNLAKIEFNRGEAGCPEILNSRK